VRARGEKSKLCQKDSWTARQAEYDIIDKFIEIMTLIEEREVPEGENLGVGRRNGDGLALHGCEPLVRLLAMERREDVSGIFVIISTGKNELGVGQDGVDRRSEFPGQTRTENS
jgi:hypothetical protein